MNIRFILLIVIALIAMLILPELSFAQCPMCKAGAEQSLAAGSTAAKGLNTGILYLFVTPYLLAITIGFIWWRNNKKSEKYQLEV